MLDTNLERNIINCFVIFTYKCKKMYVEVVKYALTP